jgi:hypothetical protein
MIRCCMLDSGLINTASDILRGTVALAVQQLAGGTADNGPVSPTHTVAFNERASDSANWA